MSCGRWFSAVVLAAMVGWASVPGRAQPSRVAQWPADGASLYRAACASCHGPEAHGTALLPRLAASENLTTYLSSIVTKVDADRVMISTGGVLSEVDAPGELLISQGVEPRSELLSELRSLAPRLGVHTVGDASGDGGSIHAALVDRKSVV